MANENLLGYLGKATRTGREIISRAVPPNPISLHTSTIANEAWQGNNDNELTEVLIIAGPDNTNPIRFSLYKVVGTANYLPLNAKDSVRCNGVKYSDLHFKFMGAGDTVHLLKVPADGPIEDADTV